ncbi:hypothetical protein [Portibacter lacus]|uniref:Uncharacterized protein n=1 Tax=Portibacter lacus TaxID=1099794 RepID=A0AA37WFD0_9BACT|nr:hypothetical protein [Portibacter lacus]GLR19841.1 hypothetical protein GCM10007940_44570 [Portibacter lacus]
MKQLLIHGLVAGLLSGIAGIIYLNIYQGAFGVNYSQVINIGSIIGASIIGCMLMTLGYAALIKFNKLKWRGWLNILIAVASFASIISPIGMSLPLSIEFPELFPGLVVPMHFFPALAFLSIYPFFSTNIKN